VVISNYNWQLDSHGVLSALISEDGQHAVPDIAFS